MEYEVLGWPPDGPTLELDHERFAYAGKFVVGKTGKAVARSAGSVVAAVAFDPDRTASTTLKLRYVTVARERRGEGIGPTLIAHVRDRAIERGFERVSIAVNNPYAYQALAKAGFAYTGETTGIAEVVLAFIPDTAVESEQYRAGLERLADRATLSAAEQSFVTEQLDSGPPNHHDSNTAGPN